MDRLTSANSTEGMSASSSAAADSTIFGPSRQFAMPIARSWEGSGKLLVTVLLLLIMATGVLLVSFAFVPRDDAGAHPVPVEQAADTDEHGTPKGQDEAVPAKTSLKLASFAL